MSSIIYIKMSNQKERVYKQKIDPKQKLDPKKQLNEISLAFLNSQTDKNVVYEMEAKFGTRGIKRITKEDYDNVVKKLLSLGFQTDIINGIYTLKIQPEILDIKTGEFKIIPDFDKFRLEILGITNIQEYCKTNNIENIYKKNYNAVSLIRKFDVQKSEDSNEYIQSANFDDFNFRVSLKKEETINKNSKIGKELFDNWNTSKKVFRYMNRVTFYHKAYPFKIDLSIVKSSSKNEKGYLIKTDDISKSNVFNNPESYEIEIEVDNLLAKTEYKSPEQLSEGLQKIVKIILSGLQKTNYPISYVEQKETISGYFKLLFEEEYKKQGQVYNPKDRAYPSDFIGPNSKALLIKNICQISSDFDVPNITNPYSYCVTDKADGERHLLYINNVGKIYLINTNMNIIFSGAKTEEKHYFNSLLDGELILHDKLDNYINTYAAFDIYFINNVDIRSRPFVKVPTKDSKYFEEGCRLPILKEVVKNLKAVSIVAKKQETTNKLETLLQTMKKENKSPINIISKKFYPTFESNTKEEPNISEKYNIFEACNYILRRIKDNLYEYEIDGLVFTPTLLGVGSNKFLEAGPKKKRTWEYSFKWKPSDKTETFPKSYNTIDFLVTTKKGSDGNDIITPVFENGMNVHEATQYNQYKTLILAVGFDEKQHGYINPCQDLLDDKLPNPDNENENTYKPKQFFPSDPFDAQAGLCNIMLQMDKNGNYQMFTEEGDVFHDETIVEFRYDISKQGLWKWIPLRVRYDKTAEFKQGLNSFGNDYTTANNNWYSIHNPVTERMIATGENIPNLEISDDVYYNSVTNDRLTKEMRDFHNLFVKKTLIQSVSRKGNTLIDFACGKGGDFSKWISANLSFVFGIDISKDNIENRLNGACARFLTYKKEFKHMPYALFVNGNSALNIRSGTNMFNDKANAITKVIFGEAPYDKSLGTAVERQKGKAANGFDVSSCQFALHYMFKDNVVFYNFIRNVAECTKLNGYFIATCYDGKTIFNMLKKKQEGESIEIFKNDKKVWSITKDYKETSYENNDSCLGYQIRVFQDSINQTLPEYLVNYEFLTQTMEKYGFTLVSREEAKSIGLPEGSGMFVELYNLMLNQIKKDPKKESEYGLAANLDKRENKYQQDISFLNRYFVYKKTSTRDAYKLTKAILEKLPDEIEFELAGTMLAREAVKNANEELKPKSKKLNKKIKLQDATEALEENEKVKNVQDEEIIEIDIPVKPKKVNRKKKEKAVELELIEE
jgi:mRNA capping enzyme/mRNA capping enzyme, catalytic domain